MRPCAVRVARLTCCFLGASSVSRELRHGQGQEWLGLAVAPVCVQTRSNPSNQATAAQAATTKPLLGQMVGQKMMAVKAASQMGETQARARKMQGRPSTETVA